MNPMKIGIATCAEKSDLTIGDRALVSALRRQGVKAVPLIWNAPNVLRAGWDAIVIRSVWDYYRHLNDFLKWIEEVERSSIRLINDPGVVRWNAEKSYLIELLHQGAPCVPSLLIRRDTSPAETLKHIASAGWSEVIVKPTVSAAAFLTFRTSASSPKLLELIAQVKGQSDVLIQPYFASIESEGELSLVFFNGREQAYSHAVLKRPGRGEFRVQSDFGGSESIFNPPPETIEFAANALKEISGDWAFARIDVIDWKQRPLLSEVEMIEPDLFLQLQPGASERFAEVILEKLSRKSTKN
jgi:glutathione synthase/RimK-type ligase-like ATP-grasp enzyme